jgi:deoxyhypusine synthase
MAEEKWKARTVNRSAEDGLVPLKSLDPSAINDFDEMLQAMSLTSFGGRKLGEAAEVLEAMVTDPDCAVVLTLSGAMTVAKMGLVITDMVERGWVQAVVSTGALMTHGLVELAGMSHFKAVRGLSDESLFERGYNRVYDTYELESNLNGLGDALDLSVFPAMLDHPFSSYELLGAIGRWLAPKGRGVASSCWRHGVPIYIPAFTDSEMGLDVASFLLERQTKATGEDLSDALRAFKTRFDPFRDLTHYAKLIRDAPRIGIFTIGGGVPRNWAQQAPPFLDYLTAKLELDEPLNRFRYAVRICPEPVHWGGLSGCSYSEGVSWGKFVPRSEGGRFAEVYSDATLVWPMLVKGVAQRLEKKGLSAGSPELDLGPLAPPLTT